MQRISKITKQMHILIKSKKTKNDITNLKYTSIVKQKSYDSYSPATKATFIDFLQLYPHLHMKTRYTFLLQLVNYTQQQLFLKRWYSDDFVQPLFQTIELSLFRSLPNNADYDEKQDKSWPHLQLIYDILARFINTACIETLQKYIDTQFVS
eukprot:212334_1